MLVEAMMDHLSSDQWSVSTQSQTSESNQYNLLINNLLIRWSYVSSMNVTRSRVALVADMDRLWAIGGYDGMKNLSTVEMYNPESDSWSFVASMESHEGGVGVGVIPMA